MLYNTSCSHDLMAANLITSNAGEGIVIKRECSQQFSRYCTVGTVYYGKPFDRNIYVHSQKHFQNYKTCSKLLTLMLRSQTLTPIPPLVLNQ